MFKKRQRWRIGAILGALSCVAGMLGFAGSASAAADTIWVEPGESIQAAVDQAAPGDTIRIKPGTYNESVSIPWGPLTIVGSGWDKTRIMPGPADPANPCAADGGNGFCIFGEDPANPISDVSISQLTVRDFGGNGIIGVNTDGLRLTAIRAANNVEYGLAAFSSTNVTMKHNLAKGSDDAGIYVGDSPDANAVIAWNKAYDNALGIFVRHARHLAIFGNTAANNCQGFLILDDGQEGGAGNVVMSNNRAEWNTKFCPPNDEAPPLQGGGIFLFGATDSQLVHNTVVGNRGNQINSGGILLLDASQVTGGSVATGNTLVANRAWKNWPAGIIDHGGGTNRFFGNHCGRSDPDGLCV